MKRPGWDEYFLNIAKVVATRSSCLRRQVGAVIVNNKDIISTGYNGSPQYQKNCIEIGFCYRDKHNIKSGTQLERCRAVGSHAESNAIALAARNGHATNNSTIYICGHEFVCYQCKAQVSNANIKRVVLEKPDGTIEEWIPENDWTIHPIDMEKENCTC
ncbi:MAG: deaminase [Candidatus Marinimicrobia bacterium]|nr:deaminase [Candidatus Neomarinimicrobiota bacterium]